MIKQFVYDNEKVEQIAHHFNEILKLIGEDPEREGLQKTPQRAAKALLENTWGYKQDNEQILKAAIFSHPGSQMVVVKDIEFYSLCEHHILPFFGTMSIGYIPDGEIVGLSKLARIVDGYARRLQVQERLTMQVCDLVHSTLANKGVIVTCEAQHLCMKMRGVEKQQSTTVTMQCRGDFEDPALQRQFFNLIGK
ncbi:MAG: GTP cyclohydrolase I FolE [Muribaculaceae bacterium]|nr:GTP cyclohydrolase I FolE [Muribaculaceae bacterium]